MCGPLFFQDVIKLETQYWTLVDIPKQEKQETVPAFVLRACSIMEKTHKSGEGVKTSARLAEEALHVCIDDEMCSCNVYARLARINIDV